jgi:hypothetical protein
MIEVNKKVTQKLFDETFEIGSRIMTWWSFSPGELSKFYINMWMFPKDNILRTTWLEFTKSKRVKNDSKKKESIRKEFEDRKKDNVNNEGVFCTVCLLGMHKVEDFRGIDNIIILSKEFLRRDPKDNKKEAFGYYWSYMISERDSPDLFLEVKQSKTIFFRST